MAKLITKNEATLRAIMKLGNATLHDVEAIVGVVAKEAINSLVRCEFIYVVATKVYWADKRIQQHHIRANNHDATAHLAGFA